MTDIGSLGGSFTRAFDMNNLGQIVGNGWKAGVQGRAFMWHDGPMQDLGIIPQFTSATAMGINDLSQVVGDMANMDGGVAVLWDNGEALDLNELIPADSGWVLMLANDVNNSGQIVGTGSFHGQQRAFVLIPTPEPNEGIFLFAVAFLLTRRREMACFSAPARA